MKRFNVRYAETFLWDMIDITLYLLDKNRKRCCIKEVL